MDGMMYYERILIAEWLSGYNTDDIKEFSHFDWFPEIFSALKEMDVVDIIGVAKVTKSKVADIAKITLDRMPSQYDVAFTKCKEKQLKQMLSELAANPKDVTAQIERIYLEIDKMQSCKIKSPTNLCDAYKDEIQKRMTETPLNYGMRKLDYYTGGIRRQELTIISARPGVGKSAFALQIAMNMALRKQTSLFFPLEMNGAQLMERIVCRENEIQHEYLKTPKQMSAEQHEDLRIFLDGYHDTMQELKVIERVNTLSEIKKHIEYYNPNAVFVDQLSQLRENKNFKSVRERYMYMTNTLKEMAMSLNVPVILLCQLNRSAQEKEPTLADLKESGSIEEDADNVIFLSSKEEMSYGKTTDATIYIAKQRNGEKGKKISATYHNKRFVFTED